MEISGPDSSDISTTAPASSLLPYCCINAAYSPPLVMSIAATSARTDSPASGPLDTPPMGSSGAHRTATSQATAILVSTKLPERRSTRPEARSWMVAPMQKNHTARIGTVPLIRPLLKDPKVLPACGQSVWQSAPSNKGTSIIPPGSRSTVALIRIRVPVSASPRAGLAASRRHLRACRSRRERTQPHTNAPVMTAAAAMTGAADLAQ